MYKRQYVFTTDLVEGRDPRTSGKGKAYWTTEDGFEGEIIVGNAYVILWNDNAEQLAEWIKSKPRKVSGALTADNFPPRGGVKAVAAVAKPFRSFSDVDSEKWQQGRRNMEFNLSVFYAKRDLSESDFKQKLKLLVKQARKSGLSLTEIEATKASAMKGAEDTIAAALETGVSLPLLMSADGQIGVREYVAGDAPWALGFGLRYNTRSHGVDALPMQSIERWNIEAGEKRKWISLEAVSYTHLTLPTNREV